MALIIDGSMVSILLVNQDIFHGKIIRVNYLLYIINQSLSLINQIIKIKQHTILKPWGKVQIVSTHIVNLQFLHKKTHLALLYVSQYLVNYSLINRIELLNACRHRLQQLLMKVKSWWILILGCEDLIILWNFCNNNVIAEECNTNHTKQMCPKYMVTEWLVFQVSWKKILLNGR